MLTTARSGKARSNATRSNYLIGGPPAPPTGVTATDATSPTAVTISWAAVTGATAYTVYRSTTAGIQGSAIGTPTATTFSDTTATPGVVYYYGVTVTTAAGTSALSAQDAGSRLAPPAVPTGVAATDATSTAAVTITWTAVPAATSYTVYRGPSAGVQGPAIGTSTAPTFSDTTATPGIVYYYGVTATNAAGTSALSAQDAGSRQVAPPVYIPAISIGGELTGAGASRRVLVGSLQLQDQLNETPNTCTFTVQGAAPPVGAEIIIAYGTIDNPTRLFAGTILRMTQVYAAQQPANVLYQVEGIDYTWALNRRLVVAKYTNQSATDIATDLIATWTPPGAGFTAAIEAGLPVLDEISFTNTPFIDAMTQLATRIGGYANCDYHKRIMLWLTSPLAPPATLTPTHPSLQEFQVTRDLSQVVTRALVEGGGVNAIALVAPGETRLPVEDPAWYNAAPGGLVVAGPQRLTYADLVAGGAGAFVGPGVSPGTALTATAVTGTGLASGTYKYAYTWVTGAGGETTPAPLASVSTGLVANPTQAQTVNAAVTATTGGLTPGATYPITYVWITDKGANIHTGHGPYRSGVANSQGTFRVSTPFSTDPRVVWITTLRAKPGTSTYYEDGGNWNNVDNAAHGDLWSYDAQLTDAALASNRTIPNTNGAQFNAVALSGIAAGPSGTTARKIYRTAVNGTQLKLLTTINDNTTTSLATPDTAADATLGANAPTADTSGLNPTSGIVQAGATSLIVSSVGPFGTTGWAVVANQVIRYTGASSTALTGIPATGPGAITASINYGREILVAAQLIGIPASGPGAIRYAINPGDEVNLLVIVDDVAAQAALAALLGGDGVVEDYQQDRRISRAEAQARAEALLELKGPVLETYKYRARDPLTQTGATITVDLPAPTNVHGTYEIQDVTIAGFLGVEQYPFYDVVASSRRFTFEDLLRRRRAATTTG